MGAGTGRAAGAPSHGGAPGCGWDQTGLLHLGALQTWRLESSAEGRMAVSTGPARWSRASSADTHLRTLPRLWCSQNPPSTFPHLTTSGKTSQTTDVSGAEIE